MISSGSKRSFGFSASDSQKFDKMVSNPYDFEGTMVLAYCSKDAQAKRDFEEATRGAQIAKNKQIKNLKDLNGVTMATPQTVTVACETNVMYILCEKLFTINERYETPPVLWEIYKKL